jgi:3-phenylpropionate/trans-cinnamate dioxygenase ferredoxin component
MLKAATTRTTMPLFRRKDGPDSDGYYPTELDPEQVGENEMVAVRFGSDFAIVTRAGGELVAFSNICPHAAADLRQGRLARGQIKCHEHGYTFDVRSGRATWPEGEGCRLMRFEVRVAAGRVRLRPAWQPRGAG